jgi:hypothetical protein
MNKFKSASDRLGVRPLAAAIMFAVAVGGVSAQAADVEVKPATGGNFVVKDSTGATAHFVVGDDGKVTITGLPGSPPLNSPVCFDPTSGQLGSCSSLVAPPARRGPPERQALPARRATPDRPVLPAIRAQRATGATGSPAQRVIPDRLAPSAIPA